LFLLAGCVTGPLTQSFKDYSWDYADTQNKQMLLNLARLSDREPIYFFQLAQISASYTFSGNFGGGDLRSHGVPTSTTSNVLTLNGTLGASATHTPVFTLIPLGGDKFAQQLLAPIKPEIFYELYEEGWPIDLLMRVLIQRIELVKNPDAAIGPGTTESLEVMINDPLASEGGHYDRFLRACAMARWFQKNGILYLDITDAFKPLAKVGFANPPTDQQILDANKDKLVWEQYVKSDHIGLAPLPAGAPKLEADSRSQQGIGKGSTEHPSNALENDGVPFGSFWQLGTRERQTLFKLNESRLPDAQTALKDEQGFAGTDGLTDKFLKVLHFGIGVTDTETTKSEYKVRLVMRSLIGSMLALANEQNTFSSLDKFRDKVSKVSPDLAGQITALQIQIDAMHANIDEFSKSKPSNMTPQDEADWSRRNPEWAKTLEDKKTAMTAVIKAQESKVELNVDTVPLSEDHPVLILNWPATFTTRAAFPLKTNEADMPLPTTYSLDPHSVVASTSYHTTPYAVGDQLNPADASLATWNRDVFRLLVQLSLQVTADPSSFALPSLLQSH